MPTRPVAVDVANLFAETGVGTLYPGTGVGGTKIYVGTMMDKPDLAVALYDSTGIGRQLVNGKLFEKDQTIDVRVRGLDYNDTYDKCEEMVNRLRDWSKVGGFTYEGSRYLGFVGITQPMGMGVDDRERYIWSFSFTAKREYVESDPDSSYELPSEVE